MKPEWRLYLTERAGHPASIVFDETAAVDLATAPQTHALRYKILLRAPGEDGLASRDEAERLAALEDQFEPHIAGHGARLVGRITTQGARAFVIFAMETPQPLANTLFTLIRQGGYTPEVFFDPDPERAAYFRELYPNGEEFNTITDFDVLRVLRQKGDLADKVRPVDHTLYFADETAAQAFIDWAGQSGFENISKGPNKVSDDPELSWRVDCVHRGTMKPEEITAWSKAVYRMAVHLKGRYGGWETNVVDR